MKVVVEIIELRFDLPAKPKPPAEGEPTIDWKHRANTAKVAYHDAKRRADELAEDRARLVAVATKWQDRAEVAEAELAEIKKAVTESSPAKVAELRQKLEKRQLHLDISYRERDSLLKQLDEFAAENVELRKRLHLETLDA